MAGWPGEEPIIHWESWWPRANGELLGKVSKAVSVPVTRVVVGESRGSSGRMQRTSLSMYTPPYLGRKGGWGRWFKY